MKKKNNISESRRRFIRNSSVAAAGFFIVPRHVLGRGFVAPSDKLNIAGIGAGGKGESDLSSFAKSPNVNIVALCDVDDRQAVKSRNNFPKANYYKDFREMLAKEKNNIDACSISTPTASRLMPGDMAACKPRVCSRTAMKAWPSSRPI